MAAGTRRSTRLAPNEDPKDTPVLTAPSTTVGTKRGRANTAADKVPAAALAGKPKAKKIKATVDLDLADGIEEQILDSVSKKKGKAKEAKTKTAKDAKGKPLEEKIPPRKTTSAAQKRKAEEKHKKLLKQIDAMELKRSELVAEMELDQEEKEVRNAASVITNIDQYNAHHKPKVSSQLEKGHQGKPSFDMELDDSGGDVDEVEVAMVDLEAGGDSEKSSSTDDSGTEHSSSSSEEDDDKESAMLIDLSTSLSSSSDSPGPALKKKKAIRGETRGEVEKLKAEKKAEKVAKMSVKGKDKKGDMKPKHADLGIMKRAAHLSGVNLAWESDTPSRGRKAKKVAQSQHDDNGINDLGGFNDEDVASSPPVPRAFKPRAAHLREDNIIHITELDTDVAPTPVKSKAKPAPKPSKLKPKQQVKDEKTDAKILTATTSPAFNDIDALPPIFESSWATRILPLVYHCFLSETKDVFVPYTKGSQELKQKIVAALEIFAPKHGYKPSRNSKIMVLANSRINEKRSGFGAEAINVVDKFFNTDLYRDQPDRILQYVKWAIQPNGSAFWATPSPKEHIQLKKGQPGYVKPEGRFESCFIIKTAAPQFKCLKDSQANGEFGKLVGGLALAAAAVERAFKRYLPHGTVNMTTKGPKGKSVDAVFEFSRAFYGEVIEQYMSGVNSFSDNRWKCIEAAIEKENGGPEQATVVGAAVHDFEGSRNDIFQASSPPAP